MTEPTQVILERRPDGHFDAAVVTRSGVELSREPIFTWQDKMRWESIGLAMRVIWNTVK